jgi:hypothetical protein
MRNMLLDHKPPSQLDRARYFYCAECETKTKVLPFYRTWCPCKESSVIATMDDINYFGCAVSEYEWKKMETPDVKIVFHPTVTDIV